MGNRKDIIWVMEVFTNEGKNNILKTYLFDTLVEVAYVLDMKPTIIYNFYHTLINPRGKLKYITIYQKQIIM